MGSIATVAAAVTLAVVATGRSSVSVTTDDVPGTDFSVYTSFDFLPQQSLRSAFLRERAGSAIAREVTLKNLGRVHGGADLLVAVHGRFDTRTEIDTATFGYPWRWGCWGAAGVHTTVRQVPIGTLVADLVDGPSRELVWQGRASAVMSRGGSPESRHERIDEAMVEVFARFPPAR